MNATELRAANDGLVLLRRLDAARQRVMELKRQANTAECEAANAESDMARWLVPKTAKIGDVYCLAVHDTFFEVRCRQSQARSVLDGVQSTEMVFECGWRDNRRPKEPI